MASCDSNTLKPSSVEACSLIPGEITSDTPFLPIVPVEDDDDMLKTRLVEPRNHEGTAQELELDPIESLEGKGASSDEGEGDGGYV